MQNFKQRLLHCYFYLSKWSEYVSHRCIVTWISMLFGIKTLTISLRSAVKCNICKRPWNQQVFSVVFKNTSLQHLAGAGRLSSPRQLPVMVISHSFSNTHTHTHICAPPPPTPTPCNSHTSSFAHLHTFAHLNTLVLFFFFPPLSFWQHNFQPNFQQKCATLSPSAAVITLSYSEMQSNFLVQD